MRRLAFFTLLAAAAVMGCGDDKPQTSGPSANYSLTVPTNVSVGQDSAVNLKTFGLTVKREDGIVIAGTSATNLPRLSYFIGDLNVAIVDETGNLRGIRGGTTTLRVQGYDDEITFPVEVRPHPATTVRLSVLTAPDGGFLSTRLDTGTFYAFPADLETTRVEALVLVESPGRVDTVYCNYCTVAAAPAPARTPRFVRFRSLDEAKATIDRPATFTVQTDILAGGRVRTRDTSAITPVGIVMEVPGDSGHVDKWKDTIYVKLKLRPIDTLRIEPGTHRVTDLGRPSELTAARGTTTLVENETWPGDTNSANVIQSSSENFSVIGSFRSRIRSVPAAPGTAAPVVSFVSMQSTNATTTSYRPVLPNITWESALNSYLQINASGGVVALCEYIGRTDRCPAPLRSITGLSTTQRDAQCAVFGLVPLSGQTNCGTALTAAWATIARDSLIIKCSDTNAGPPTNRRLPGTKQVAQGLTGTPVTPGITFGGAGNLSIAGCPLVSGAVGPNVPMPGAFCTTSSSTDQNATCTVWIRGTAIDPATGRTLQRLYRVNIRKS